MYHNGFVRARATTKQNLEGIVFHPSLRLFLPRYNFLPGSSKLIKTFKYRCLQRAICSPFGHVSYWLCANYYQSRTWRASYIALYLLALPWCNFFTRLIKIDQNFQIRMPIVSNMLTLWACVIMDLWELQQGRTWRTSYFILQFVSSCLVLV